MLRYQRLLSMISWLHQKHLKACAKMFAVAFVTVGFAAENVQLLMNHTPSLPYRYFLHFPRLTPRKGDLTTYEHVSGPRLIKQIIGQEGDKVSYDQEDILWVDTTKVGLPKQVNNKGQTLIKIPKGVIPKGHVFLFAPHEESFDSRYAKVGLVYEKHLGGRAIPIAFQVAPTLTFGIRSLSRSVSKFIALTACLPSRILEILRV